MRRDSVFNPRRIRLLRTHVSRAENLSAVLVLVILIALVVWVTSTRDDFDPGERDLPVELLYHDRPEIQIYNRPLRLWVEPGQQPTAAGFDLGPYPAATLDAEWQPVGRVKRFQANNLYEKINGEAEKFIKQGFVELAYLLLRSATDGSEIAIELFDQGDLGGSLGVFAEHAAGRAVEERSGVTFFPTSAGVIGRTGRYFFRVAGDRQSRGITDKAMRLVAVFSNLGSPAVQTPQENEVPAGFALLHDRLGIAEADIQFQESNVFQYDFAQRFWFGAAGLGGNARVFVHIADNAATARDLVAALLEEQRYEYDEVESDGPYALFRHRFLETYFVAARRGRYVYGMEKLPTTAEMAALLQRIGELLSDGET